MTCFRTCHTCAKPNATCPTRGALQTAIAGLHITSVKHRCPDYAPAFLPGEPVKVETFAWYHRDDDPPPKLNFPGHFIQLVGAKALVFVKRGAIDLNGEDIEFEPNGRGYLKVPLSRVAVRDGEAINVEACRQCAAILDVGDPCGRDPNYTPTQCCLKAQREAADA